jgi:hypothetical protein
LVVRWGLALSRRFSDLHSQLIATWYIPRAFAHDILIEPGMVQILMLDTLVSDFAKALKAVDTDRPIAISGTTKRAYQAGIGPHTETATLRLIKEKLIVLDENMYRHIETGIPYPKSPKQKCDWRWTTPSNAVYD